MLTTKVRGVNIKYQILGDTGPWAALISGGRSGHEEMLPLARQLSTHGYRVLVHDRRNTGASDIKVAFDETEEEVWAADLDALLGEIGAAPAFVGGSSSGARTAMLTCLRHPAAVRGLLLMRVTGGAFAAGHLPDLYYGQFIRAAREGGMAAVCAHEKYQERIAGNPAWRYALMGMRAEDFISMQSALLEVFKAGVKMPVIGVSEAELGSIKVPTIVIPGNDNIHSSASGLTAQRLIPGSELYRLPIADQDMTLIPFQQWQQHYPEIARAFDRFMQRALAAGQGVKG